MAQPTILQTSDFRPSALETLKEVAEGGWASVTRYNLPYVELHPAGTAERIQRLEVQVSLNPPPSPAQVDTDRRTQFKRDTIDRIQALVGRDKLEALRLLTELQAELLASGASA